MADYHTHQIFSQSEQGGRFVVFDWQTVNAGNGGDDLARIIGVSLTPEQQQAQGEWLAELYRALLAEEGVAISAEQCRERFRLGLLTSAAVDVTAAASLDPQIIDQDEALTGVPWAEALFGRLASAMEAHDVLGTMPG